MRPHHVQRGIQCKTRSRLYCCTHLECTDLAGTAQSIYLTSTEKKSRSGKPGKDSGLFAGECKILLNTWYCIAGMMGIADEHRPSWQSSAAGLESIFLESRSPSTAKPLPGLAAVPQLAHRNQTVQAASEGCVCLLQEGTEAEAIAINKATLNKQLYFSGIRAHEEKQQIRTGSVPTQPLQCLSTNVRQICHGTDKASLLCSQTSNVDNYYMFFQAQRQMNKIKVWHRWSYGPGSFSHQHTH